MDGIRAVIVGDGDADPAAFAAALGLPAGPQSVARSAAGSADGSAAGSVARPADGSAASSAPARTSAADRRHVLVIGADGGARKAEALGCIPDLIVGDADSLGPGDVARYRRLGVEILVYPAEKDESDLELCVAEALRRGVTAIRICGALAGDRIEHALANVALLAGASLDGFDAAILHRGSVILRIGTADGPGTTEVRGEPGDFVSLLPLEPTVAGVTTEGLRYRLRDEPLTMGPTRGLSNELTGDIARIATRRGRLIVIHTPRPAAGEEARA